MSIAARDGSNPIRLAVLGGSSSGMPALVEALRASQEQGRLGMIDVRLFGRDPAKLAGMHAYIRRSLPPSGAGPQLSMSTHVQLAEAIEDATHIVCLVRAGGMAGRARDEALALAAGVPADEGIALGGLACFLRGREVIRALAARCRELAPAAIFLQMSSPLGLNVAIAREAFGSAAYGVCELPLVTKRAVLQHLASLQRDCVSARCAGLNHQSWLYAFEDRAGRDCTAEVLDALDTPDLVGVEPEIIREYGAVPLPYLRLYLHAGRVLAAQSGASSRGSALALWSESLDRALRCESTNVERIGELLAQRRMNWFHEGLVPVLEAFNTDETSSVPLNVPSAGALGGISPESIIEIDCSVSSRGAAALPAPPLPEQPLALTQRLADYERAVLSLSPRPTSGELAAVLRLHPLAPSSDIEQTAQVLSRITPEAPSLCH